MWAQGAIAFPECGVCLANQAAHRQVLIVEFLFEQSEIFSLTAKTITSHNWAI